MIIVKITSWNLFFGIKISSFIISVTENVLFVHHSGGMYRFQYNRDSILFSIWHIPDNAISARFIIPQLFKNSQVFFQIHWIIFISFFQIKNSIPPACCFSESRSHARWHLHHSEKQRLRLLSLLHVNLSCCCHWSICCHIFWPGTRPMQCIWLNRLQTSWLYPSRRFCLRFSLGKCWKNLRGSRKRA